MDRFSPSPLPRRDAHAVVIGAGLGGLAMAAALSRHVTDVTVVERDALSALPGGRAGVPQGRHLHGLQPGGLAALERLVPGYTGALVAHGGQPVTVPGDVLWMSAAGWMQPFDSRRHVLVAGSRDLIEWVTRMLVAQAPGVRITDGTAAEGLVIDSGRVVGVDARPSGADGSTRLSADLVVDCSGRRSPVARWLAEHGYGRPPETVVRAGLGYASRTYRRGPDDLGGWKAVLLQGRAPDGTRSGVMFPIEDDRWMLTLGGMNGDVPPTDDAGFLAFARTLRSPVLADVVERLEPLSPIAGFRRIDSRRAHFDRMRRLPDGLLVAGDAACAFNPVYAQGMSAAAMAAEVVDAALAEHRSRSGGVLAGATAGLQRAVARAADGPWMVSTGEDSRFPATEGAADSMPDRLLRRYMDRVVATAAVDPVVNGAFVDVVAMMRPPTSLLRPALSTRVLGRRHPRPPADPPLPRRRAVGAPA
jgi:2-polyprenyl-6-methoxyphenol hydroxylase-like FAD-dependent oxidoreductase